MAAHHTASVVAKFLSAVESDNSDEENDECSELSDFESEISNEDEAEHIMIVESSEAIEPPNKDSPLNEMEGNSEVSGSNIDLVPKKGTKSEVWRHFGLCHCQRDGAIVDIDKPVCRLCSLKVSAKQSNTTNLFVHLKNKHPDVYIEVKKLSAKKESRLKHSQHADQPSIKESFLRYQPTLRNTNG